MISSLLRYSANWQLEYFGSTSKFLLLFVELAVLLHNITGGGKTKTSEISGCPKKLKFARSLKYFLLPLLDSSSKSSETFWLSSLHLKIVKPIKKRKKNKVSKET